MDKVDRILVIDGEEFVREILAEYLQNIGYRVYAVPRIAEGRDIISSGNISVVLLSLESMQDIEMRAVDELRRTCPGTRIVLLSDYPALEDVIKALRHRIFDFIIKPFDLESIEDIIGRACRPDSETLALRRLRKRVALLESIMIEHNLELPDDTIGGDREKAVSSGEDEDTDEAFGGSLPARPRFRQGN